MAGYAVFVDFAVNVQPSPLFPRGKHSHDLFKVTDHFLSDSLDETRGLRRWGDHDLTAILDAVCSADMAQFLQSLDKSSRSGGAVSHEFGDAAHAGRSMGAEMTEKEKLRKGDLSAGKFTHQGRQKTSLHHHDDGG